MPQSTKSHPVRDWHSSEGDDQEDNAEYVKPIVYAWMLGEHTNTGNFRHSWMINPDCGIEELAFFAAGWVGPFEAEMMLNWHTYGMSKRDIKRRQTARMFINIVWIAITSLIEEGKVELHIELGWPSLRLTEWTAKDESIYLQDSDRPRAEEMRLWREALRVMPYPEYLKSDEWRFRREAHLEAAGERCQLCNSDETPLHVHHRTYANRGREKFYDLVVLCAFCHKAFHESGRGVR